MKKNIALKIVLLFCFLWSIPVGYAQESLIPTTAISNMPSISFRNLNLNRNDYNVLKTISSTAVVSSDLSKRKRTISEINGEFKITYKFVKINGKRYLEYDDCDGVIRLGYIGGTGVYNSDSDFLSAEEIVNRLALYRLISLAKEYGADALFEPTITTTAAATKNSVTYNAEAFAKLIKIIND